MLLTTTTSLGERLAITIAGLYAIVAPTMIFEPARVAFWVLVLNRLNRMVGRLDRLVAHFRAGTLPTKRPSRARHPRPQPTSRRDQPPLRLPRGHAWLVRLIQRTAQFGGPIEALINSPEGAALLAAAPQAGRIFRPLCRMLGIDPPTSIRLPPRPRPKRPRPPKPPRAPDAPMHPISPIGFRPSIFNPSVFNPSVFNFSVTRRRR